MNRTSDLPVHISGHMNQSSDFPVHISGRSLCIMVDEPDVRLAGSGEPGVRLAGSGEPGVRLHGSLHWVMGRQ